MPRRIFKNHLRNKLKSDETTYGFFVTLEDPTVTEVAALAEVDWICMDMEHGSLDFRDLAGHLRASQGSELSVLVRLPTTSVDNVKRALDLGAHGVVLPLVGSAEQLREGFAHGRYPPLGARGLSNARANDHSLSLAEYIRASDDEVMIIPIIETAQASANIAEILAVDGLEAVFFGPADLSMSRGFRGVWEGPGVGADILRMNEMARSRGIATAIMGLDLEDIERRELQGFRMLGLGSDVTFLFGRLHDLLVRQRNIQVGLGWK